MMRISNRIRWRSPENCFHLYISANLTSSKAPKRYENCFSHLPRETWESLELLERNFCFQMMSWFSEIMTGSAGRDYMRERLKHKTFTINETKSGRITKQTPFLGYTVSAKGIEPDDRNVNKSLNMVLPSIIKQLDHFYVLDICYGGSIPNFRSPISESQKKL